MNNRETIVSERIQNFFSTRLSNYHLFHKDVKEHQEIAKTKMINGSKVICQLDEVMFFIQEYLIGDLFPQKHTDLDVFFSRLEGLETIINVFDFSERKQGDSYYIDTIKEMQIDLTGLIRSLEIIGETKQVPYELIKQALEKENISDFVDFIKALLASISYALYKEKEGYLQSHIFLILRLLGFETSVESATNTGRIDCDIRLSDKIYILEFKNGKAKTALEQIKKNKYCEKYILEQKKIIMVGISFDQKAKTIGEYEIEEYKRTNVNL